MTFMANGEYLVGGADKDVRVWRVADGKQVAMMKVQYVLCVATSRGGRWIGAGSAGGDVFVWDATTYEQVFADRSVGVIRDVDFSPDSTRLVSVGNRTAITWDIASRQKVRTLDHSDRVLAAKYSPEGDRIATATEKSVLVWDSSDGRLLIDVKVQVKGRHCLFWCKNYLCVQTYKGTIERIDAATGFTVSGWSVTTAQWSCIALPQHGKFIACFAKKTITFWDAVTPCRLGLIQHTHDIRTIACSSDGELLAIVPVGSKIIVKKLFQSISVHSMPCPLLHLSITSHSRSPNLILTTLHLMHGKLVNSRMQKHYYPRQS